MPRDLVTLSRLTAMRGEDVSGEPKNRTRVMDNEIMTIDGSDNQTKTGREGQLTKGIGQGRKALTHSPYRHVASCEMWHSGPVLSQPTLVEHFYRQGSRGVMI